MLCNEILFGNSIRRPSGYQLKRALDNCSIARQISGLTRGKSMEIKWRSFHNGLVTVQCVLKETYGRAAERSSNINLEVHTED
ncbi:hypothetical protein SUGI_1126250 [Cryptomeria japonica]|nr:hypothetical protein SUGI_1126250 [Cryptomeria japonica]